MTKQAIIVKLAIFFAILVVANLVSSKLFFRLDFTADKRYTLSEATKSTLKDLDDVITVTAYFSEDLPPQLLGTRKDFRDLLEEYAKRSNGNLVYEFINPNQDDESETKAQAAGINPLLVNVTERDQVQQMRAYMGAILRMKDEKEVLPVIEPGAGMEYGLTTAIKKMAIKEKPVVGVLQGHGEPSLAAMPQLQEQLQILYDVQPVRLTDTIDIPGYLKALILVNPRDTISSYEFGKLDNFMDQGGGILVAYDNFLGALNSGFISTASDIGLKGWLGGKGIVMTDQLITDVNCASVGVPQQVGPFSMTAQVQFPYFPVISNFEDHPASGGIEAILLPFASALNSTNVDSSKQVVSLAYTSEQSGSESLPMMIDVQKQWAPTDFTQGTQSVAIAVEGAAGKLVVVGSGSFMVNGEPAMPPGMPGQPQQPPQQQQLNPDNINFVANAIDWMSDDSGLSDLRTKGITSRPLDPVEDGTRSLIKYANVAAPIVLVLLYGIQRRQRNLRKRQRWLEGKYI
jgi:gliding-associated putative ABC transporter substrate-binding component GldG